MRASLVPSAAPGSDTIDGFAYRSPFVEFDASPVVGPRGLGALPLTAADVERLRGLGDPIDLAEVDTISAALLAAADVRGGDQGGSPRHGGVLRESGRAPPYVIGVAGSVAVGKSSMSRLLREMLSRFPENPSVALVSTTGSSLPNAELERGLMEREGLPPSRSTVAQCCASCTRSSRASRGHTLPVYSHLTYDIVPDARIVVCAPPTSSSSRD